MVSTIHSISTYKETLSKVVSELTLNEASWGNPDWKKACTISPETANDAFSKHSIIQEIFRDAGEITPRKCKTFDRIEQKKTEQRAGRENYFKVVSDLTAGRIHTEVSQMTQTIDRIKQIVQEHKGQIYIRGSSEERPYGFSLDSDKKHTDITQYAYVFLEEVGYPTELQIGHRFASHTFTIDSALRDNPNCGQVDLWTDGFYDDVKNYILQKANGENSGSKEAIQAKAEKIHAGKVPQELQNILNSL